MTIQLNHTIVPARDPQASAQFLADILGVEAPGRFGPFHTVKLDNGVTLDFIHSDDEMPVEHYAFLVSEDEFDAIFGRIVERGLVYAADPHARSAARSTTTTAAAASTGTTRTGTGSRSSRGRTAAAAEATPRRRRYFSGVASSVCSAITAPASPRRVMRSCNAYIRAPSSASTAASNICLTFGKSFFSCSS